MMQNDFDKMSPEKQQKVLELQANHPKPVMKDDESGKAFARRLISHSSFMAKAETAIYMEDFKDRTLGKNSILRLAFEHATHCT